MQNLAKFIQNHFWIFFIGGIILGISAPEHSSSLRFLLEPALVLILLLVFLKLELKEIFRGMKNWKLMSYLTFLFMIAIPVITYFLFAFVDQTLAVGFLLLAAMPPGTATPALTDLVKGNSSLSMSILIICCLLSPFTIPLLFQILPTETLNLETGDMFWKLTMLIFIPLILSIPLKKYFNNTIQKAIPYFSAINVLIIFFFIYIAIGPESSFIISNIDQVIWQIVLLYVFFIVLHFIGYVTCFKKNKEDKIAITVSNAYMNNGLAIILATLFFPTPIIILTVLSELPWCTLLGPFKKIMKQ